MPKYGKNYNDTLILDCDTPLREALVAIDMLEGGRGMYARPARNLLQRAVEEYLLDLDPRQHKKYEQLLESIHAQTIIFRQRAEDSRRQSGRLTAEQRDDPERVPMRIRSSKLLPPDR